MNIVVHTDGGARGNPGPAAIGVVIEIYKSTNELNKKGLRIEFGKRIGETTNNVAEYTAVIEALSYLKTQSTEVNDQKRIDFYLDSKLVVNQLNGLFKVKDGLLRELLMKVRILEREVGGTITYKLIPREQNGRADTLVNSALDSLMS